MGMYDYVHVEVPLPDGTPMDGRGAYFQTKDFPAPNLEHYTITKTGRLHKTISYGPGRESLPQDMNFHGILTFYTMLNGPNEPTDWREFNAKFTDGQLVEIIKADGG